MSPYLITRTIERSGKCVTTSTTLEAPTMNEVLTMHQVVRMQDAGIESTAALAAIADSDDSQ